MLEFSVMFGGLTIIMVSRTPINFEIDLSLQQVWSCLSTFYLFLLFSQDLNFKKLQEESACTPTMTSHLNFHVGFTSVWKCLVKS